MPSVKHIKLIVVEYTVPCIKKRCLHGNRLLWEMLLGLSLLWDTLSSNCWSAEKKA